MKPTAAVLLCNLLVFVGSVGRGREEGVCLSTKSLIVTAEGSAAGAAPERLCVACLSGENVFVRGR